jgi:uncharacterized RDD family membrane protein YckC
MSFSQMHDLEGSTMSYSGSGNTGWSQDKSQDRSQGGGPDYRHAFDPYLEPELFRSVPTRRVIAFIIDLFILVVPIALAFIFIAVFGLVTLGLGWALFWLVSPASIVWALIYYGSCLGGPHSATIGMRMMDLEMRTWYGAPCYFLLGAIHPVLYWISVTMLSPFVLLVGPFNSRKRLLHDFVLGTVVINNSVRAPVAQPARTT